MLNKNDQKTTLFEEFMATMWKVRKLMEQSDKSKKGDEIATILQLRALSFLKHKSGVTVGNLGDFIYMSSSSVAQFTDRLVDSGWVEKREDLKDRRQVKLHLTDKGQKKLSSLKEKKFKKIGKVIEYMTVSDLKQLLKIHRKVLSKIEGNL